MQSQTVTAITISIAAQEVRRPLLRTFVPLSMIRILQFCSLFVYFCSRFLAEIAREERKTEDGGRRGGKKGTADDVVSNQRASDGRGTGRAAGMPVDAPMGLRLHGG